MGFVNIGFMLFATLYLSAKYFNEELKMKNEELKVKNSLGNFKLMVPCTLESRYEKYLSFEFALTILITTIILVIFEFLSNKIVNLLNSNKSQST